MELLKIRFKETTVGSKIDFKKLPEHKFAITLDSFFFKEKKKRGLLNDAVVAKDRKKNYYIARNYYRRLEKQSLEIDLPDDVDKNKYYEKLKDVELWKEVIVFLMSYADADILKFYSQTINGVFSFYFKHYDRLKAIVDSQNIESEERKILSEVRRWKKEDAINTFYVFITKIYRSQKPEFEASIRPEFYQYFKYTTTINHNPAIKPVVLKSSPLLRGLLLKFEPKFRQWAELWQMNVSLFVDYEELRKLCETQGAEFANEIVDKDLDDIIGDAISRFYYV